MYGVSANTITSERMDESRPDSTEIFFFVCSTLSSITVCHPSTRTKIGCMFTSTITGARMVESRMNLAEISNLFSSPNLVNVCIHLQEREPEVQNGELPVTTHSQNGFSRLREAVCAI